MNLRDLREYIKDLPDDMNVLIAMVDGDRIRDTNKVYPLMSHKEEFLMLVEDWA